MNEHLEKSDFIHLGGTGVTPDGNIDPQLHSFDTDALDVFLKPVPQPDYKEYLDFQNQILRSFGIQSNPYQDLDPVEGIEHYIAINNLRRIDLSHETGLPKNRISEILQRRISISKAQIRIIHKVCKIPLECLIKDYEVTPYSPSPRQKILMRNGGAK